MTMTSKEVLIILQAQKQEKLLELYKELAVHRLIVINKLLKEIMNLADFDTTKGFIDYIKSEAKYFGDEDTKIVEKIKELEK